MALKNLERFWLKRFLRSFQVCHNDIKPKIKTFYIVVKKAKSKMLFGNISIKFDRNCCDKCWIKDKEWKDKYWKGREKLHFQSNWTVAWWIIGKKQNKKQDQNLRKKEKTDRKWRENEKEENKEKRRRTGYNCGSNDWQVLAVLQDCFGLKRDLVFLMWIC